MGDATGAFRDLHEALGELVIASSGVEESLQDGIWTLGGALENKDKYKVASSPLGWLVDKFHEHYRSSPQPLQERNQPTTCATFFTN